MIDRIIPHPPIPNTKQEPWNRAANEPASGEGSSHSVNRMRWAFVFQTVELRLRNWTPMAGQVGVACHHRVNNSFTIYHHHEGFLREGAGSKRVSRNWFGPDPQYPIFGPRSPVPFPRSPLSDPRFPEIGSGPLLRYFFSRETTFPKKFEVDRHCPTGVVPNLKLEVLDALAIHRHFARLHFVIIISKECVSFPGRVAARARHLPRAMPVSARDSGRDVWSPTSILAFRLHRCRHPFWYFFFSFFSLVPLLKIFFLATNETYF